MMVAAAWRRRRRRRSSLVVHIHVMHGEATWAVFTLMRVLTPVCPAAAVSSWPVLGRADTDSHTQQPFITVGDVTIVEHFAKWSTQAPKTMTDSSGLLYDHQYFYYYALTPFTLGMLKSCFLKIDYRSLKIDFSWLSFPDIQWQLVART